MREYCLAAALFAAGAAAPATAGYDAYLLDRPATASASPFKGEGEGTQSFQSALAFHPFETRGRLGAMVSPQPPSSFGAMVDQARSIPWELAGVTAGLVAVGVNDWSWGDTRFHFKGDGWFGKNAGEGGIDKLGHAFTSYVLADFFTWRIRESADNPAGAAYTGAALALGLMIGVEVLDGITARYGFSWPDVAANATGAGFSLLRNTVPGLKDKLDYRVMIMPPSWTNPLGDSDSHFQIIPPYKLQRYYLALKLAGFETFQDTPLRFVELHAGYYISGFTSEERRAGFPRETHPFVGFGLNLNEVLFGPNLPNLSPYRDTIGGKVARTVFEYVQVPYTSWPAGR